MLFDLRRWTVLLVVLAIARTALGVEPAPLGKDTASALTDIRLRRGIVAVLGLPGKDRPEFVTELATAAEFLVYFQSPDADQATAVRKAAEKAGLLGKRVFVDIGDWKTIHLADNLAGAVWAPPAVAGRLDEKEVLRVLHPEGKAILGAKHLTKPAPEGVDHWSHPYHGPDNNPQSTDQLARAPYLTQFIAGPKFSPMPQVSVAAGGRVFKAFGHISHKTNQNAVLNTLLCVNGYNGTILWKRDLKEGFVIHRNTMIATPDTLYFADGQSCKLIDARTGEVTGRIVVPEGMGDGPVWKWMALQDGVLYALVGGPEIAPKTQRTIKHGLGHWPWGMWEGYDYKDPKTNFGFGRTFLAIDPNTKKILWHRKEKLYVDSRGVCMSGSRIYFYTPDEHLSCLDVKTKKIVWRADDAKLLKAIGPQGRAQHFTKGFSTSAYIKSTKKYIFFAGPQRSRLVAVNADNGKLLWNKEDGNRQLVLRPEAIYAAGALRGGSGPEASCVLDYKTGAVLRLLPKRRSCTRATGSIDSVFYRAKDGTYRIDVPSKTPKHIAPMRPPCHDGVIISDGMLYWGPWMCGCELCLYGHIGLTSAGNFNFQPVVDKARTTRGKGNITSVKPLEVTPGDWPCYGGNSGRTFVTRTTIPAKVDLKWTFQPKSSGWATAPITAGGMVFFGDTGGVVRALDADDGSVKWTAYTAGAIFYSPSIWKGRLFVGSADGRVYAFEAATGRQLWSFQAAPARRLIPVFDRLISTWPVAGGIVVKAGVVYAAAGIVHYDGTYVYALDAVTGKVKWHNDTSGTLSKDIGNGISLQGGLHISRGELRFEGGNVHKTARYDLQTGKCLTKPNTQIGAGEHVAFWPYYPQYGQSMSMDYTFADGRTLSCIAAYDGNRKRVLTLLAPATNKTMPDRKGKPKPAPREKIWKLKVPLRFNGFIIAPGTVVTAGQTFYGTGESGHLIAYSMKNGSRIWLHRLPRGVVRGGMVIDHQGRIFVSLQDGRVLCYAGQGK